MLAQKAGPISEDTRAFLDLWEAATQAIQSFSPADLMEVLGAQAPVLANPDYVEILQSAEYGCVSGEVVSAQQLRVLAQIRKNSGAYAPSEDDILRLSSDS